MRNEPLKGASYFYEKFLGKGKISKTKIKALLKEIRDEIFPLREEIALSDEYCKARDPLSPQEFFQGRFQVCVPGKKVSDPWSMKEIIIFGSRFQLKLLEENVYYESKNIFFQNFTNFCKFFANFHKNFKFNVINCFFKHRNYFINEE